MLTDPGFACYALMTLRLARQAPTCSVGDERARRASSSYQLPIDFCTIASQSASLRRDEGGRDSGPSPVTLFAVRMYPVICPKTKNHCYD